MTIDEAIEHAEEIACGNDQCAKDHAQLADWLRELRRARMEIDLLKTLRDGFKADAQKYKAENAKLRAERDYLLANSNPTATELRRVRSAWKKDRDENAKLRELVKAFWWCTENFDLPYKCDRCPLNQSSKVECECEVIMRELGMDELGVRGGQCLRRSC